MNAAFRLRALCIASLLFLGGVLRSAAQLSIVTPDTTICAGASISLTASYTGRTPNLVNLPDDKYTGVIPIGFPFTFYGNTYTSCLISSNGYITFDTGPVGASSPFTVPTTGLPISSSATHLHNTIMACYADLYPNNAGDIDWALVGTAPNRRFVATWCNMPYYLPSTCPGNIVIVQAVLYEGTSVIEINTRQKDACSGSQGGRAIQGLQNSAGTVAHIVPGRNAPTQWTAVNSSYQFTPSGSGYTVASIPYSFISRAAWYANNTTYISTANIITVNPTASTFYTYRTDCADNLSDTVAVSVLGSRLYVDSAVAVSGTGASWASPLKTVSRALGIANRASCVNEIWVKRGTYFPGAAGDTVASSRDSSLRILRSGLKVYGSFAGGETALTQRSAAVIAANPSTLSGDIGVSNDTADNAYHVVTILAAPGQVLDSNTTLDGFIITRGIANGGNVSVPIAGTTVFRQDGGGVYIGGTGTGTVNNVRIRRCTITGNRGGFGAGAYLNTTGSTVANSPLFDACTFTANRVTGVGGAVCLPYATAATTTLTFRSTSLSGNRSDGDGGALFSANGAVVFENSTVNADTSGATGGGIRVSAGRVSLVNTTVSNCRGNNTGGLCTDGTNVSVISSRFLNNVSNIFGGGITQFGGTMSLRSTVFSGNSSVNGGGGVHSNTGAADSVINCVFTGNTSSIGGGLHHGPAAGSLRVINSTFAGNTSTGSGGAIAFETQTAGATGAVSNTILWGNTAAASPSIYQPAAATAALAVTFSDVQGGYTGANNLAVNPVFINPADPDGADNVWATTDDGLRLDTCSPAIGAGSNPLIPASVATTDITGAARIQFGTVDMGAYEHPYNFIGFPDVTINNGVPSPACAGSPVTFTATATGAGIASYQWFINSSATATTGAPTFTTSALANGDTVWVILTNLDCGYSDTSNRVVITVNPAPGAIGTISGPTAPCVGTTPTYSIPTVPNATSYTWTLPGGWSGTSTGSSITPTVGTSSGNITVTASNNCGTVTATALAVTPVATPVLTGSVSGPDTVCAGSTNAFSVTAATGATTYTWTTPTGWTGTSTIPTLSSTASATGGTVTVVAGNVCGTSATLQKPVAVIGTPATPAGITGQVAPCVGTPQTYSIPAIPGATSYTWTLPVGWIGSSTTASIGATVGTASGNVTVTAGNVCGTSTASILAVTPVSGATAPGPITGPQTVCSGAQLTYSVAAVPGASSYTWTLPGGWTGSSTTSSIVVTTTAASGTISVTATNSCGQTSTASTLAVTSGGAAAQPGPITGAAQVCAGVQQTYSITPTAGASSYTWTLPGGWTGSSNTASITATPGATGGVITVVANASCGASSQQTLTVVSASTPAVPGTITGATAVCNGVAQTYSVTPVAGATSYTWALPAGWSGSSNSASISTTPAASGGTITVTASNYCGTSASSALVVSSSATPAAPGIITGATQVCTGVPQTYSVAAVAGAASYTWTLPTGWSGSSSSQSILATPTATGGTVSVTATNYCGTSTASTLAVNAGAAPVQPGTVAGPDTVCTGVAQTFSVTPVPGATSYTWTLPTGWSGGGTGASISVTPGASGGSISVTAVNACGTSAVQTKAVPALAVPAPPGGISGAASVCSGTTQTYSVTPVAGAASYTWSLPGGWTGTSNGPSISVTTSATSGNVTVSAASFCGTSSTSTLAVNVTSAPTAPGVVSGATIPCVGSSQTYSIVPVTGATTYTWTLPGGWAGSSTTASIGATVGSTAGAVTVTAGNNCGTSAAASLSVTPLAAPGAAGTISGPAAPCPGTPQTYSIPAVLGATTYTWQTPAGWTGSSTTPTLTTTPGSNAGSITVTASNACGSGAFSTLAVAPPNTLTGLGPIAGTTVVCSGTQQTYSVTPATGAVSYAWSVPAGWSGTLGNGASITVTPSGSGTVSVYAVGSCGSSPVSTLPVTVNSAPATPTAISGAATPCVGTPQTYSIGGVTGAVSHAWTLPSGWSGSSSTTSISTTAAAAGGTISVTATNTCGTSAAANLAVTPVSIPVQPSAITGAAAPCSGTSQTYSVPAVAGATQYAWTLPTGWSGTSSTSSISTTPTSASGTISVTASNACGTSPARTLTVTPQTVPAQPGAITLPASQCQASSGTYSVTAVSGATSYTWTFPTGWSGGGTTASVTATAGASGTISVTANNVCGPSAASSTAVTISPLPVLSGAIAGATQLCVGSQASYTAPPASNAVSYAWTLPSILSGASTGSAIAASATTAGTGNVQVTAVNACGSSAPVSLSVTVNPSTATAVYVTSTFPNGGVCPGVPATFTAVATGGGATPSFIWTRNGSVQTGVTGSTFTLSNPQNGEVIGVSMASTATCPLPATAVSTPLTVTVLPAVVPGININTQYSNVPTICAATQLNFTANIVGGGTAPAYQWLKNGAIVGTNAPTYSASGWSNGDTVWAILTSNAQCATPPQQPSNKIGVTVGAPFTPAVNIAVTPGTQYVPGQTYTFTATASNPGLAPTYQWMRNGQNILGAFNATYTTNALTGNDTISVKMTTNDACATTPVVVSNKIVMSSSTAVQSVNAGAGIGLYPNPNDGAFMLSVQGGKSGARTGVEVLNALGQIVWQREVVTDRADWTLPVELSGVANGVYLLRMRGEDGAVATMRFEVRK